MINELKKFTRNYLENMKLSQLMVGTCVGDGIKVSDKLIIPSELVMGGLKDYTKAGDRVRLIRNHGGQEFYIVEIIAKSFMLVGTVVSGGVSAGNEMIPNEKIVGNLKSRVTQGDEVRLLRDYGKDEFYMLEVII